jgi:signal transduction histidine kinase
LAIVKKIVERQGGRIGVKSAEGQGAKFVFTWPKKPPKAKISSPAMATVPNSAVPLPT